MKKPKNGFFFSVKWLVVTVKIFFFQVCVSKITKNVMFI